MTATISLNDLYFSTLAAQHEQATELRLQGAALHNDVEAQLIEQLQLAVTCRDGQAIRDINAFMTDVMWDCGDDFYAQPEGVINFMRHYDRLFTPDQLAFASSVTCDAKPHTAGWSQIDCAARH